MLLVIRIPIYFCHSNMTMTVACSNIIIWVWLQLHLTSLPLLTNMFAKCVYIQSFGSIPFMQQQINQSKKHKSCFRCLIETCNSTNCYDYLIFPVLFKEYNKVNSLLKYYCTIRVLIHCMLLIMYYNETRETHLPDYLIPLL